MMQSVKNYSIALFMNSFEWRSWLEKNHQSARGLRLQICKKNSGKKSVSYDEALDEALCFGWIDSKRNKYDQDSWIQNFTPRRPKSLWSKRNKERVTRLFKEGRMKPAGLKEVETAQNDGRWKRAYASPKNIKLSLYPNNTLPATVGMAVDR